MASLTELGRDVLDILRRFDETTREGQPYVPGIPFLTLPGSHREAALLTALRNDLVVLAPLDAPWPTPAIRLAAELRGLPAEPPAAPTVGTPAPSSKG